MIRLFILSYFSRIANFFYFFNMEKLKDIAVIFSGFAAIATIFLVAFSYKQFKIFLDEYREKNQSKIVPFIDYVAFSKESNNLIVLKFINDSNVIAQNFEIKINEDWLKNFKTIKESNSIDGTESSMNSYEGFISFQNKKDNYLIKNQSISFFLCLLNPTNVKKLNEKKLSIDIIYYKKNLKEKIRQENFLVNLSGISGCTINLSNHVNFEREKLKELNGIKKSIYEFNELEQKYNYFNYNELLKKKLNQYYELFGEFFPNKMVLCDKNLPEDLIQIIDNCIKNEHPWRVK